MAEPSHGGLTYASRGEERDGQRILVRPDPFRIDGRLIGEVHVQPGTEEEVTTRAIATLVDLRGWSQLGAEIADLGEHRLKIAAHAARVAAAGGRGVSAEEEARIADWFRGIVQNAVQGVRVGAARPDRRLRVDGLHRSMRHIWA
jgi:hypothetical protein